MRVLFTPDYRGNPYQDLLAAALAERGVEVVFGVPLDRAAAEADVVHLHWEKRWFAAPSISLAARRSRSLFKAVRQLHRAGRPVVWTVHNLRDHDAPHPRMEHLLQRRLARRVDGLAVHYPEAAVRAGEWLGVPADRFRVTPIGSYASAHPVAAGGGRAALGLRDDDLVMVSFGSIRRYKRLPLVLEAFRMQPRPDLKLVIAGSAGDRDEIRRIEELAARDPRVVLRVGRVSDEEAGALLAMCDLFVLYSADQLTTSSAVAAMDAGLGLLVDESRHLAHLVGEAGAIFVRSGRATDLAAAFGALDPERVRRMGEHNRQVARGLTWDDAATELADLYEDLTRAAVPLPPTDDRA